MSVTDVHQADDLDEIHPEFWPGRVTMQVGGEKIERYGKHMRGEMERPMSMEEVQEKFVDLSPKHDDATRKAVFDVIADLENRTVNELVAPFKK
jgi:2-methylcitrate dehydratase PrpD